METKRQSYWWWFDSHNCPKYSPWLQSTLAELDEKTKVMLKLIDEDADSFAQRAEMYYKKRPELINMVEDFYRAHRSLAERYDQLRINPTTRVRSPLRHSFSHFSKSEYENVICSVKSFDSQSFTEEAYHSEESAESEIDDPELEDDTQVDQDGGKIVDPYCVAASYDDELMDLREELERLQQERAIQMNQIKQKDKQNGQLMTQISDNINELRNLREELEKTGRKNALIIEKQTSDITKLKDETQSLKLLNMNQMKQFKQKEEEKLEVMKRLEEAKYELKKLRDEMQIENFQLNDVIRQKDEEKREVIRQLSIAMEMLREENLFLKKSNKRDNPKRWSPPEIQIFKGIDLGKFFSFSSKCQTSVVPL